MKKLLRSITSIFLSIIMLTTLTVTVYASNNSDTTLPSGEIYQLSNNSYVLQDLSSNTSVKAYNIENGISVFEQYNGNQLQSKYLVRPENGTIQATYYDYDSDSDIAEELINIPNAKRSDLSLADTTSQRLGRIRFQYSSGEGSGICGAYVDFKQNTGSKKYDINGTYRDLAGLASFIASVLALPAAPALGVAKSVFSAFSFALGAVSVTIPSCPLDATYEQNEYLLTDIDLPSHTNNFYGTKYTITEAGKHINDVYTDGTYYPTTSWNDQNFGMTIYNYLFNYSNWRIYAWN